jgi:hypothetical protein
MPSEVESLRRIGSSANNKSIPGDRLLSDSELPLVKEVRMSETSLKPSRVGLFCSVRSHLSPPAGVPLSDRNRPLGAVPLTEELQLESL